MRIASLRLRLLLAAALAITLALIASAFLLTQLFMRHVEDRVAAELQTHLNQIAASADPNDTGGLVLAQTFADPRFIEPYSGLYWQLDVASAPRLRSRSLWDFELPLPVDELQQGNVHRHELAGPKGSRLFAVERALTLDTGQKPISFRIVVAVDRREIDEAATKFSGALARSLLIVGMLLILAFGLLLHFGLRPLHELSAALKRVHAGRSSTVDGAFPSEVQALVADMNALLDQQRRSLTRAREQAADLAHGFKTPLAVLSAVARDLERDGRAGAAEEIVAQVGLMEQHVRRELARARTAGSSAVAPGGVAVVPILDRIVAAMRRIAADRDLDWSVSGDRDIRFAGDETDLLEMVGNLCENASKWARSKIRIDVSEQAGNVHIRVGDDGPGIPAGGEVEALTRGRRLDESAEGSGLGLAIVARAAAAYGGRISLGRSPLAGLEATIVLPAAGPAN